MFHNILPEKCCTLFEVETALSQAGIRHPALLFSATANLLYNINLIWALVSTPRELKCSLRSFQVENSKVLRNQFSKIQKDMFLYFLQVYFTKMWCKKRFYIGIFIKSDNVQKTSG